MTDGSPVPAWFTAAIGAPVTLDEVDVDGVVVRFRSWGSSTRLPGLLLVHGGAAHARWWDHVAPLLATDRRVTALDLSGHGDSDRRPEYSFDIWAREVWASIQSAGLGPRPVLMGHSMGGAVAIRVAALHGERLSGLVVVDTPLGEITPEQQAAHAARAFGPLHRYATEADAIARFRPVPDQPASLGYVVAHVARTSVRLTDGGWTWKFDPAIFARSGRRLEPGTVPRCPTTFLRAENGLVAPDDRDRIGERLGAATRVHEIPGAGHHVMLDRPRALVEAIAAVTADQAGGQNSGSFHQG